MREPHVVGSRVVAELRLDLERTLAGARDCVRKRRVVVGLPEREHGVAGELEHVATRFRHQLDEAAEVGVQEPREVLGALGPARGEPLGERREARDVGEQDRGRERLGGRPREWPRVGRRTTRDSYGNVACERLDQVGHCAGQ